MKIAQPLALPGAIGHLTRPQARRIQAERATQPARDRPAIRIGREECLDASRRPEPELARCRLEDRRGVTMIRIDERDGDGSAGEAGGLGIVRRKPPEIPADLEERVRKNAYLSPRRLSR